MEEAATEKVKALVWLSEPLVDGIFSVVRSDCVIYSDANQRRERWERWRGFQLPVSPLEILVFLVFQFLLSLGRVARRFGPNCFVQLFKVGGGGGGGLN